MYDPSQDPFFIHLPPELEPVRPFFLENVQPYITIDLEEQGHFDRLPTGYLDPQMRGDRLPLWASKVGGLPYLPRSLDYPCDRETGEYLMFLMQIHCSEVPSIPGFDFPTEGILQFFSGLNVPMCELSPQQHYIRYLPEINPDLTQLITDFSFLHEIWDHHEWYDGIYQPKFSINHNLFWEPRYYMEGFNVPDQFESLLEESFFDDWLYERSVEEGDITSSDCKLAGYPELHSYVQETLEDAQGRLLLEINHPCNCDDHFYFYIQPEDLKNHNFEAVESFFMRV